jgi:hypothetical protein
MSSVSEGRERAPGLRALLPGVRRHGASTRGRNQGGEQGVGGRPGRRDEMTY